MKKSLIAFFALFGVAYSAEPDWTYSSNLSANYSGYAYGFTLNLSSSTLNVPDNISSEVELISLTLPGFGNNPSTSAIAHHYLVLDNTSGVVLGWSNEVTSSGGSACTYTFKSTDNTSALVLSASTTYRYLAVSAGVMDIIEGNSASQYIYNAGGTGDATYSVTSESITISQGLVQMAVRGAHGANLSDDALFINGVDGVTAWSSGANSLAVIPQNIKINVIPEPTTATLSLLALAGLAARRRRK